WVAADMTKKKAKSGSAPDDVAGAGTAVDVVDGPGPADSAEEAASDIGNGADSAAPDVADAVVDGVAGTEPAEPEEPEDSGEAEPAAPAEPAPVAAARRRRRGRWIEEWDPQDASFWKSTGRRVASRNLIFSIFAEHLGFTLWSIWSVVVV